MPLNSGNRYSSILLASIHNPVNQYAEPPAEHPPGFLVLHHWPYYCNSHLKNKA